MNNTLKAIIKTVVCIYVIILLGSINNKLEDIRYCTKESRNKEVEIKLDQPEYLLSNNPKGNLMSVLEHYEVKYPEIVYAQAVLETGNFNSRVYKEYNNLFGLYNSYKGDYYKFDHWVESVIGYLNYIQYRYNEDEDYYDFLSRIGYAEDPNYILKVKQIVNQVVNEVDLQKV